jgi:Fe-S cluster assembly ATP-binding protein
MLTITNLTCSAGDHMIIDSLSLQINKGEIHVLMGPNGSGKSTLAKAIMGYPGITVDSGSIKFNSKDITYLPVTDRARLGIFMAFQYPLDIPGVNFRNFLRLAYNSGLPKDKQIPVFKFKELLTTQAKRLDIDPAILDRNLNEDLSGGEKKKSEILQLAILKPKLAILDETDSGLDIDALKSVFAGINILKKENPDMALLIITHYHKVFDYLKPDRIHILKKGRVIRSGKLELLKEIETYGFKKLT